MTPSKANDEPPRTHGFPLSSRRDRLGLLTLAAASLFALAQPPPARAFELSLRGERILQGTTATAAYGFAAANTAVMLRHGGGALPRSWVGSTVLSSVTLAGIAIGFITTAIFFVDESDVSLAYGSAAPPGLMLGGAHLGVAIRGGRRGEGGFWMQRGPAWVSFFHGLTLASLSSVLIAAPASGESDVSKILPIYLWTITGALLALYALGSLIVGASDD